MTAEFRSTLLGDLNVDIELDAQIGAMTYFAIGGRADALIRPHSADALSLLLRRCHEDEIPCRILGKGANLLVDDQGVDGLVIKLDHECFTSVRFNREGSVDAMHAMAGADLAKIVMETSKCGLDGLSAMAGIPASIGGAIRMNAGGIYGEINDSLSTVTCLTHIGELITYKKSDVTFDYRECKIADPIILSATFELHECDPIALRTRVKEIFAWKKSRQPLADSSAGCAFKNPLDKENNRVSAGKIIDDAGLKGLSVGGASVSEHHANFITTNAHATGADVISLMKEIQRIVLEQTGFVLQNEVVIWSRDPEVQR
jgi:UDP-N-acetylmuramate dehydrogenase